MSLLQSIDLVEGILNTYCVTDVRDLPWKGQAVSALEAAGFKYKTIMQIWQNIAQIGETMRFAYGKGTTKDRSMVRHAVASCLLGGIPYASDDERDHRKVCEPCLWRRMVHRKVNVGILSIVCATT